MAATISHKNRFWRVLEVIVINFDKSERRTKGIIAGCSSRTRFLRRSAARGGQSRNRSLYLKITHSKTRTAIREKPLKTHKALSADPPRARYTGACEKGERGEGGGSHGPRARQRKNRCPRKPTKPASMRARLLCLHHSNHHLGMRRFKKGAVGP